MSLNKKYVLVTGGAGYIGSHTVVALSNMGFVPVIVDDFRNAQKSVVERLEILTNSKIIFHETACQNKLEMAKIFDLYNIWGVIHFAADKAVGESVENPLKYFENNLGGLISLLDVMKEKNVNRLVFSSSCTVYGIPEQIPVDETSPRSYASPYGFTKLINEQMLEQFNFAHPDFRIVLLRYFNPVGAHESALIGEEPSGVPSNLLPYLTQTAVGKRDFLTVHGNDYETEDGTCLRDYIHVMDLADAHVAALNYMAINTNPSFDIFNIGTGKGTSVKEMIDCFEKHCKSPLNWKIGPRRAGDVPKIYANADKAKEKLKWQSKFTVEEAIISSWKYELARKKE
jgi:UDP-glucose 4-epimerase